MQSVCVCAYPHAALVLEATAGAMEAEKRASEQESRVALGAAAMIACYAVNERFGVGILRIARIHIISFLGHGMVCFFCMFSSSIFHSLGAMYL